MRGSMAPRRKNATKRSAAWDSQEHAEPDAAQPTPVPEVHAASRPSTGFRVSLNTVRAAQPTIARSMSVASANPCQPGPLLPQEQPYPGSIMEALRGAALQHGGFVLGVTACVGTAKTYNQDDRFMVWKILAWCLLAMVGLVLHELRPFQRPQR